MAATLDDLQTYCEELYERTYALWRELEGTYPTWRCRYSILYAPPRKSADLMILGANPGFDDAELYDDEVRTWPSESEYWTQSWPLALRLRELFSGAGLEVALREAVGSNLLFFKSKSLGKHASGLGWLDNPVHIRRRLEAWCRDEVEGLIHALNPRLILAMGMSVYDNLRPMTLREHHSQTDMASARRVVSVGSALGRKVIGIMHPTGARISTADFALMQRVLAEEVAAGAVAIPEPKAVASVPAVQVPVAVAPSGAGNQGRRKTGERQSPFRPHTVVEAGLRPPASFGYQPIHDFWHELRKLGRASVEELHEHMLHIGWRRPNGGELTYDVMRTDVASMCKNGFAIRVLD